jgi:hypothetical protein
MDINDQYYFYLSQLRQHCLLLYSYSPQPFLVVEVKLSSETRFSAVTTGVVVPVVILVVDVAVVVVDVVATIETDCL